MKERIYDILRHSNVPRTEAELATLPEVELPKLHSALAELQSEARIAVTKKGKFAIPEKLHLIAARAAFLHNGTAVARPLDGSEQLRIDDGRLRPMPDDLLLVRSTAEHCCAIESICHRARNSLSAFVRIERSKKQHKSGIRFDRIRATAVPCDRRIPYSISLDGDLSFVRNNEIALIEITAFPEGKRPIFGRAERVLGNADSMLARLRATAEDHGFPTEFTLEVEECARRLAAEALPQSDAQREDLRDRIIFTIDGVSSKDFDDAVSIDLLDNGAYRLGVHIADVSHYVLPGSPIDQEARARGVSLYLPGCTIPMLPEALSNDACSLMPNADRLAMSLFMDISANAKLMDFRLTRSIIRSKARLTYDGVNRFFEFGEIIADEKVLSALQEMRQLSEKLRARRKSKGSIDFDLPEPEFVLNEKYEPTDILCPNRGEAERMIEDFMLLANETVARLAQDAALPFLYRIHEKPDPERIHQLEQFLNLADSSVYLGDHPHPGMLQRILEAHADDEHIEIIRRYMLRALKRAQYSEKPVGHYALAMDDYCHFTSPIRRYPDLMIHRMLKLLLDGADSSKWESRMPILAQECSLREQESVKAERSADDMMKAAYMSHQIGRKFQGVISGVTAWGVYVTLNNTVEGLIHVSDMDDYYFYDAQRQLLQASGTNQILKLGMQVRIRVLSASIERGEVNFELINCIQT